MASLKLAAFAEKVVVDRFTNNVDLHCLVETMYIPEPPESARLLAQKEKKPLAARAQLALFLLWARDDFDTPEQPTESKVDVLGPKMEKLMTITQVVDLDANPFVRSIVGFPMWPMVGYGAYTAIIRILQGGKWKKVGSQTIRAVPHILQETKPQAQH